MIVKKCMKPSCNMSYKDGDEGYYEDCCLICGAPLYDELLVDEEKCNEEIQDSINHIDMSHEESDLEEKYVTQALSESNEAEETTDETEEIINEPINKSSKRYTYYLNSKQDITIVDLDDMEKKESLIDNIEGPRILVYDGPRVVKIVPIEYDETLIGRKSLNNKPEVDMSDLDKERCTSRNHAIIYIKDESYYIKRVTNKNSLHVNKEAVTDTDIKLENEDIIILSRKFGLEFKL